MTNFGYWYYWAVKNMIMGSLGIHAQHSDGYRRDKHLTRIAKRYETTPKELCKSLLNTGDTLGTISFVLREGARAGIFTLGKTKEEG